MPTGQKTIDSLFTVHDAKITEQTGHPGLAKINAAVGLQDVAGHTSDIFGF